MSEIPEQFVLEARELLAAECDSNTAHEYRRGRYDDLPSTRASARVLYERQQPTFEQRVEAMCKVFGSSYDAAEGFIFTLSQTPTIHIYGGTGRELLTLHPDGTVVCDSALDATEAGRVFVESIGLAWDELVTDPKESSANDSVKI